MHKQEDPVGPFHTQLQQRTSAPVRVGALQGSTVSSVIPTLVPAHQFQTGDQRFSAKGTAERLCSRARTTGYRLQADEVELWVSAEARTHDRARWTRARPGDPTSPWTVARLQP